MTKGWAKPVNTKKYHYFEGKKSLCGSWVYFGPYDDSDYESPEDCKVCRRKLKARK